jgi:hypothetical protein
MRSRSWILAAAFVAVLVGGSLAYDSWIDRVSSFGGTLTGRHSKCGPWTTSGPKEPNFVRAPKRYMLMARLDDGRLVRVEREAHELPACGATLTITERVTPWGSVWYQTKQ